MTDSSRRSFIGYGIALVTGLMSGITRAASSEIKALMPTPAETEGPFYPVVAQKDRDFDLTRVEGREGVAQGRIIFVEGRVLDTGGNPLEDATVDLWQANAAGRYHHPDDRSKKYPLDPNFQGWAIVPSGKHGAFRFKTIFPGAYGNVWGGRRTPHIHFKISKPGYKPLTTQMYFPGEYLNKRDFLLRSKSEAERKSMIATLSGENPHVYSWDIILQKI